MVIGLYNTHIKTTKHTVTLFFKQGTNKNKLL